VNKWVQLAPVSNFHPWLDHAVGTDLDTTSKFGSRHDHSGRMNGGFPRIHAARIENASNETPLLRILDAEPSRLTRLPPEPIGFVRPSRLLSTLVVTACLAPAAFPFSAPPAQAEAQNGYERTYTIHADGALLPDGRVVEPAYVSIDKGTISGVSTRPPAERRNVFGGTTKPTIIRVEGTLAPTMVDAWSGLPMAGRDGGRRPLPQSRIIDDFPVSLPGGSLGLAARVDALRSSGIGAVYLGRSDGSLQRGLGTAAGFSAYDLPYAVGDEWLDLNVGGSGAGAQIAAQALNDLFDNAIGLRESRADHADALEKYEEDLKSYEEKLQKYLDEKAKADAEAEKSGTKADDPKGKEKKEAKRPKRPSRPKAPKRNEGLDLVLEAIDGKRSVRLQSNDATAISVMIDLADKHDLKVLLVGGAGCAAHADALADAGIGLALDLGRQLSDADGLLRDFAAMQSAGVDVALSSGGRDLGPMLLSLAGELIAAGAEQDDVWNALTSTPARLLGLEGQFGRVGRGAAASLILFGGSSPFDASGVFRSHQPK